MASRLPMRDVVFLLPGICGSILEKDGKEIWAPTARGIWQFVRSASRSLETLTLAADDPRAPELGDGVRATRLVDDIHIVPGLWKIDGYSSIRRALEAHFELYSFEHFAPGNSNYVEVPYDWRRDNIASAWQLGEIVNLYLSKWQQNQNLPNARAIFLAHSMGGLVVRHWLEVMEGWRKSRALVTFGTPFRGSPKALGYLVNGSKPKLASLTALLRSCTSVYQLLPIYKMVLTGKEDAPVVGGPPIPNLDVKRAGEALKFHRNIEVAARLPHDGDGCVLLPMVGTGQPTLQSASLVGGKLAISSDMPSDFDPLWPDGDGTVPYVSAIPLEMSSEPRLGYVCEQHGSIQNNNRVLDYLSEFLRRTQTKDLGAVRGETKARDVGGGHAGLSLAVEDFYDADEEVTLSVALVGSNRPAEQVVVTIEAADEQREPQNRIMEFYNDCWQLRVRDLPAGIYRVHVQASVSAEPAPSPITGIFEVADERVSSHSG